MKEKDYSNAEDITESVIKPSNKSDEDNIFQGVLENNMSNIGDQGNPLDNPYSYLKMSFNEMTEIMKGNATLEEITNIKNVMDQTTHKLMGRAMQQKQNNRIPGAQYVSSNANFKKKLKTHGTSYV